MHAFAEALESVPNALAENSGLSPIETVSKIKSMQVANSNPRLGVDCVNAGTHGRLFDVHFAFNIGHNYMNYKIG